MKMLQFKGFLEGKVEEESAKKYLEIRVQKYALESQEFPSTPA